MKVLKSLTLAGVFVLTAAAASQAGNYGPRQYYSSWSSTTYGYYYRTYYYKPYPTYTTSTHYLTYPEAKPMSKEKEKPSRRVVQVFIFSMTVSE